MELIFRNGERRIRVKDKVIFSTGTITMGKQVIKTNFEGRLYETEKNWLNQVIDHLEDI